jgi:hypothetical protein
MSTGSTSDQGAWDRAFAKLPHAPVVKTVGGPASVHAGPGAAPHTTVQEQIDELTGRVADLEQGSGDGNSTSETSGAASAGNSDAEE